MLADDGWQGLLADVEPARVQVARASHVLPLQYWRRQVFRLLRWLFGEQGRMSAWTRCWRGQWYVDLQPVGGPSFVGPFDKRADALLAERRYIEENVLC